MTTRYHIIYSQNWMFVHYHIVH